MTELQRVRDALIIRLFDMARNSSSGIMRTSASNMRGIATELAGEEMVDTILEDLMQSDFLRLLPSDSLNEEDSIEITAYMIAEADRIMAEMAKGNGSDNAIPQNQRSTEQMSKRSYRGIPITREQFFDLMVIAITKPNPDGTDEAPWDLKMIAEREGFVYAPEWIEQFSRQMEDNAGAMLSHDCKSTSDPPDRICAYANESAYEVAPFLREKYYGFLSFEDYPMHRVGYGIVTPESESITVDGKEAIRTEKDNKQAEKIARLEDGPLLDSSGGPFTLGHSTLGGVPASDRFVPLNHNSPEYKEATESVDAVIGAVVGDNEYGDRAPDEKEAIVAALKAGRQLLDGKEVSVSALQATLLPALQYIAENFTKGALAALGAAAVAAVLGLL